MIERIKVTFKPDNKEVYIERGKSVLNAALACGIHLNSVCGGEGICGKCKIKVKKGEFTFQSSDATNQSDTKKEIYPACLTYPKTDIIVEILRQSRIEPSAEKNIYSKAESLKELGEKNKVSSFEYNPLVKKIYLEIPKPTINDNISDLERVIREISSFTDTANLKISLANTRSLPELLRQSNWKITVTIGQTDAGQEILDIEQQDNSKSNLGFVFDIGTTTISGQLIDLNSQKILGTKLTYNKQVTYGADVISRIIHAKNEKGLENLHKAVVDCMNEIIDSLASENNIDVNDVYSVVCAGNTTMTHLLLRINPAFIKKDPYTPAVNTIPIIKAHEIGIQINPHGLLYNISGAASYLGGDITSGIIASGIYSQTEPCILIDIGTNGEIIVGNNQFLVGCAASAGPAFEGSGLTCGMKATKGAIEKIHFDKNSELGFETIGDAKPVGICGSGYIDIISELLKAKIIDRNGKITELIKDKRVKKTKTGREFKLQKNIVITEADIDNIKRAKAAIYAAIITLIKHLDLNFNAIKNVFIAGGFGTYIDIDRSISIGLLPDIAREKFVFIGNSSLNGAREAIFSTDVFLKSKEIAKNITYIELSSDSSYMNEYMAALFFPHTDKERFHTVNL